MGCKTIVAKTVADNLELPPELLFTGCKKKEKMLDYIRCMVAGKSLRACAKEVGISLPTSFAWRHKILAALQSFEDNINFFGVVEMDELLMDYSEKGRIYKNAEELKRARKQKPKKVAVLAATDRSWQLVVSKNLKAKAKFRTDRAISEG